MDFSFHTLPVRKVAGGVFSNWVNRSLRAGDSVQVMAPQGRFLGALRPNAAQHHLGIAGGCGITPVLSIMKTVLAREPNCRFTLLYGNRQLRSTMFKSELEDLKDRYLTRLAVRHVFSDEQTDSNIQRGVMNRKKVAAFVQTLVHAPSVSQAYICGPFQMNDEAEAALLQRGACARAHPRRTIRRCRGGEGHRNTASRRSRADGHESPYHSHSRWPATRDPVPGPPNQRARMRLQRRP